MGRILLKNGLIMDGTGEEAYQGDILIEGNRIQEVSAVPITVSDCKVLDCAGMAIAPGFIDAHSHYDQLVCLPNELDYTEPFIRQGVTTYVAGQCGYSPAGICGDYPPSLLLPNDQGIGPWNTYHEFFENMRGFGMRQNLAMLAGHTTALSSAAGMTPQTPIPPADRKRTTTVLEEGMDAGCKGISFGLGYPPCKFMSDLEIREFAETAVKRGALIGVHSRVYNSAAPFLYGEEVSEPHNIRWHREFLGLFKNSGARIVISHMAFIGKASWLTYEPFFEMLNEYITDGGMDLWFDIYPYAMGAKNVGLLLIPFFYDHLPSIYESKSLLAELQKRLAERFEDIGYPVSMMMLCNAYCGKYRPYHGMFLPDLLEKTGMSLAEFFVDLYRESKGAGTIYTLFDYPEEILPEMMKHPHALYGTDAWYEPGSHQNAGTYGGFAKFLRLARETDGLTMEQAVKHMTGLTADRYHLYGRGYLRKGYFADIVVFSPDSIAECATVENPDRYSKGIRHVFVNGSQIIHDGNLDIKSREGLIL